MIYITGFMSAGKTTTGQALGQMLNRTVYDTDFIIEQRCKKSISAIFQEDGEPFFREKETDVLTMLASKHEDAIVTTGGGAIVKPVNRKLMRSNGTIVFLYCDIRTIHQRLSGDKTRPLVQRNKGSKLDDLYHERMAAYLDAAFVINTTGKSVSRIAEEIQVLMYPRPLSRASCR